MKFETYDVGFLAYLSESQAAAAMNKVAAQFRAIGRPDLAGPECLIRDIHEIDLALAWLTEVGYWFDTVAWLDASPCNFSHDYGGILRHVDPETGELVDCFIPRFARPAGEVS